MLKPGKIAYTYRKIGAAAAGLELSKPVYSIFLLASHGNGLRPLLETVSAAGLTCRFGSDLAQVAEAAAQPAGLDAALLDTDSFEASQCRALVEGCRELKLPVLAVVPGATVESYDPALNPDEFILSPVQRGELLARIRQAKHRVNGPVGGQLLKIGDLAIDLERYDVMMSGRRVSLTYKEFQLLVLLASNPGRVYTRDVLLSQIWGYDYLGGTRTVDVHVRRLRSKIEDPDHSFVETIWNVGYRFRVVG